MYISISRVNAAFVAAFLAPRVHLESYPRPPQRPEAEANGTWYAQYGNKSRHIWEFT